MLVLIHLEDPTVDRIKALALKIIGVYGLDEVGKILLNVMNPDKKMKVLLDLDFGLKCLIGIHNLVLGF